MARREEARADGRRRVGRGEGAHHLSRARRILAFAIGAVVAALVVVAVVWVRPFSPKPQQPQPATREACAAAGGQWGKVGMMAAVDGCEIPIDDAGKLCWSSNQCEKSCVADVASDECRSFVPLVHLGRCSDKTFGCHCFVEYGWRDGICVD